MNGIKEFVNNSCFELTVVITVRAGFTPGCVFKIEEFCLKCFECKKVCYGNELNSCLDAVCVCYKDCIQCARSELVVKKCGSEVDRLINDYKQIIFINAGPSIVITASRC